MPFESEVGAAKALFPTRTRSDGHGFGEKPVLFLLSRKASELLPQRMVGGQEGLLAVQDRRVRTLGVVITP